MSVQPGVYLGGVLASHARGQTLGATFGAQACESLPVAGALFVLGKEFQTGENATVWVAWAATSGRVLVVIPPFDRTPCNVPTQWEARRIEPLAGSETTLGTLLASERRHEIRGRLLPLEKNAGQIVTAGWRKHPAAGLVVITALPIWSLTALDHKPACDAWLTNLIQQAGKSSPLSEDQDENKEQLLRAPTAHEWTLLLHLCTGPFMDADTALKALSRSSIHSLPPVHATPALATLTKLGLAEAGGLTAGGERLLLEGPYAAYARALRRRA